LATTLSPLAALFVGQCYLRISERRSSSRAAGLGAYLNPHRTAATNIGPTTSLTSDKGL